MYGFGGVPKFPEYTTYDTDHCFPLTGNPQQHEVHGLEGITECYMNALKNVVLCGPTLFGPLIKKASEIAKNNIGKDIYTVLLILTDGVIDDMKESISLIN